MWWLIHDNEKTARISWLLRPMHDNHYLLERICTATQDTLYMYGTAPGSGRIYGTSLIACARRSLMLVKLVPSLPLALAPSHDQVLSLPLVLAPLHEPRQGLGRVAERVILYRSAHRRLIFLWSCRNLASPSSGRSMVSHGLCVYRLQQ